ncbi:MAG: BlaI/MecI/CopY family transcriptional regulator [Acidobacteriota bacterium]
MLKRSKGSNPNPLGDREADIMQVLWDLDRPAAVGEVQQSLVEQGHEVAYTTIQTMLNRLEAKGRVRRERQGRAYHYTAASQRETVARAAVGRVLDRFFDGSAAALATHLVGDLSRDELERVQDLIAAAREEAEG